MHLSSSSGSSVFPVHTTLALFHSIHTTLALFLSIHTTLALFLSIHMTLALFHSMPLQWQTMQAHIRLIMKGRLIQRFGVLQFGQVL